MADEVYERVLCTKNEVFVYKIPARSSNRGYRAAEWTLDQPAWTGRLRCVSMDKDLQLKLEDRNSGELFAMCPVDCYPGVAVEPVLDSSRYFVIRIQDPSGRHAFIGIGFADRADSFDLLVTVQEHFKVLRREENEAKEAHTLEDTGPKLDLSFKEGQTIKINIGNKSVDNKKSRPRNNRGGTPGLLPPPPGMVKLPGPPRGPSAVLSPTEESSSAPQSTLPQSLLSSSTPGSAAGVGSGASNALDSLLDFGPPPSTTPAAAPTHPAAGSNQTADPWGDFASAGSNQGTVPAGQGGGWVQF